MLTSSFSEGPITRPDGTPRICMQGHPRSVLMEPEAAPRLNVGEVSVWSIPLVLVSRVDHYLGRSLPMTTS